MLRKLDSSEFFLTILNDFHEQISFASHADVLLVSGSYVFCTKYIHTSKIPLLAVLHTSSRLTSGLKRDGFKASSHLMVGGATSFRLCYYISQGLRLPRYTSIRRTIQSFLEFGIRGFSTCPTQSYVSSQDRLPINNIRSYIQVKDSWDSSKTIFRRLTTYELGYKFGIPRQSHPLLTVGTVQILIPVQLLDALLLPNLHKLRTSPQHSRLTLPVYHINKQGTYLPQVNAYIPHIWYETQADKDQVAKNDDAQACISFWDGRITTVLRPRTTTHYNILRSFLLRVYRRKLFKEFYLFFNSEESRMTALGFIQQRGGKRWNFLQQSSTNYQSLLSATLHQIKLHGIEAISRAINSTSFMDWTEGSSLFFWRWHLDLRLLAFDGIKPYIWGPLPTTYKPAKYLKEDVRLKLLQKFIKFIKRGYFSFPKPKSIRNFIDYFFVAKGEDDIRPVFNGTSCGLTTSLWSPSFWLLTASTLIRATTFHSKFVDLDFGEMFHNFPLHHSMIPYSGVDLTPFRKDLNKLGYTKNLKGSKLIATWTRTWMGLKTSPEHCVRYYYFLEEFVRGSNTEVKNPLRWDRVIINTFGNPDFNPSLPFFIKWDDINNRIAGELLAYVDDLRGV